MKTDFLTNLTQSFLDMVFPWQCLNCQKEISGQYPICPNCLSDMDTYLYHDLFCPVCLKKMPQNQIKPCKSCQNKTNLLFLKAALPYENYLIKEAIHRFKYQGIKSLSYPLTEWLLKSLKQNKYCLENKNWELIPVPLHNKKIKQRGFNQAQILAEIISQRLDLPVNTEILFRTIDNPAQANISDMTLRKNNVKDIFLVKDSSKIKNKSILLIDDVFTTGATLEEAAKILKEAGAQSVAGLVIAKG